MWQLLLSLPHEPHALCTSRSHWHTVLHVWFSVYCKVKVKFTLLQASWPWRGGRGIALPILNLSTRRGWVISTTPPLLNPGKDMVPIVKEAGWAPGPVWTCAKNFAPTGIQSPDRPARSQLLHQLSYPALSVYCRRYLIRTVSDILDIIVCFVGFFLSFSRQVLG
jgi:hypothetical protein